MWFLISIGTFFVTYMGGTLILQDRMTVGELVQFSTYAGIIYGPIAWITHFPRALTHAVTAAERIMNVLDEIPTVKLSEDYFVENAEGRISIKNVTFGYKSYEPVLKNINIEVQPGEMIGLVGHSGSGKSTLINLIMRLYDPDDGSISLDGKDLRFIEHETLRKHIGVVLQETFLFSGTILQNIRYSKPSATLEEIIEAAKVANAHNFIIKFPDGYDTYVGERGQRLSVGEKQRIAIARAILNDPKILILDEATASVDTETEASIQEALGRLIKSRTTFAIAHRLSTLKNATRLMVIDRGKVIELGSHDELMKLKGKYYSLVMTQNEMHKVRGYSG
jgi:ATP-binding cassette subfamily B protein